MSGGDTERRVIDGRFALESRLGGGGMGTVWRARDVVLDRAVALKEVRPPDPGLAEYDPEAARVLRARVLREARALARVEHPNVVTIHHVVDGGENTYPWLVMELVPGGSLQDRLDRGPMETVEAARLGREVLAALRAAHDAGIRHRDVKPANVLLRPDGRPVLTDFGIAAIRESTALTATGSLIGTPDYMAPERITGDDGGPGADLWSLAMMLYVAVEGRHPLRRATTLATLAAVLNEELPAPRRAGALTGVLDALLVKDPAARPGPEAVDRMLAAAARGESAGAAEAAGGGARGAAGGEAGGEGGGEGGGDDAGTGAPAPTSYPLAPPVAAPGPEGTPPQDGMSRGADPRVPPPNTVPQPGIDQTGIPQPGIDQTGIARSDVPRTADADGPRSRALRRIAIGSSLLTTVAVGVAVWALLPGTDDAGDPSASPGSTVTGARTPGAGATPPSSPSPSSPSSSSSSDSAVDSPPGDGEAERDLLTPEGIRRAVKAIEAEAGTDRVASFSVYPEHVSAWTMVKGSDKRYDSYSFRDGSVSRDPISGTLFGGQLPVSLDTFDWDTVPALLRRAERELKVEKPTSRYLLIRQPNELIGSAAGMALYLSNEYGSGYLEADSKGKVTKLTPAVS
ncbi:serine/threonine-protein kinase [Streptomyces sp. NPDC091212]|uniref:serine/threonine-protein kinase n=1 Tax=Streptomyces sp. NPDC091212 TaxID=3155191 RepID=UPI003435A31F